MSFSQKKITPGKHVILPPWSISKGLHELSNENSPTLMLIPKNTKTVLCCRILREKRLYLLNYGTMNSLQDSF